MTLLVPVQRLESVTTGSKIRSKLVSPVTSITAHLAFATNSDLGMQLHLFCILPASLLVCLQFVPAIRHKIRLFHRLNGYTVVTLSLISNAGVLIIAKHAFGGDFATQTYVGLLVVLTTLGYVLAWTNIKLLQIDQHRAWMMRTWAWVRYQAFPLPELSDRSLRPLAEG